MHKARPQAKQHIMSNCWVSWFLWFFLTTGICWHIVKQRITAEWVLLVPSSFKSCKCLIRRAIFSMKTRVYASINNIMQCIVHSDIYFTSLLRRQWIIMLYNILQFSPSTVLLLSCLVLLCLFLIYGLCFVWNKALLFIIIIMQLWACTVASHMLLGRTHNY